MDAEDLGESGDEECRCVMKLEVLEKDDNKLRFTLEGSSNNFLNTIRRVSVSEVPVMAIEEVAFTKNSSVLYNEIIAHRLGLVPLRTDLKTYKLPNECKCGGKGCNACSLKLSLNAKGPKVVTAGELKSKDPKVVPAIEGLPITKLNENQEIKFNATANLGVGKDHSKFVPCLFVFNNYPELKVIGKGAKKCIDVCPKRILEMKGDKVIITNPSKCDLCKACVEACPNDLELRNIDGKYIGYIESWGHLEPKEILLESVKVLNKKLKEFVKALK